ncbi:MAG: ATP-binding protein [Gammaproteobacteria bacterium]|nr:ATP-binding protein [Gammaproteobacteria bacterium]
MLERDTIRQTIVDQRPVLVPADFIEREAYSVLQNSQQTSSIVILLGVRRCGKSTLLQKLRLDSLESDYYINFDDDRLAQFTVDDFQTLYELFIELYGQQKIFFFDEIQNIPQWERFVRRLHDLGYKIYITGSNASLFSQELGTRLTGRYIEIFVYPFSFTEFLRLKSPTLLSKKNLATADKGMLKHACQQYLTLGGFPNYLEFEDKNYLKSLYESILYRDIITRYHITSVQAIKELVFYLASNVSKDMSYNAVKNMLGLKNPTTVKDYCDYLSMSFLCFFVMRYDPSVKKQILHTKKVYFIDTALTYLIGFRHSDDFGRLIENVVFLELKRRGFEVFFHKEKKECDFVLRERGHITQAIQVCYSLEDEKTKERELAGLIEALSTYQLQAGWIITWDDEKTLEIDTDAGEKTIHIISLYRWLLWPDF